MQSTLAFPAFSIFHFSQQDSNHHTTLKMLGPSINYWRVTDCKPIRHLPKFVWIPSYTIGYACISKTQGHEPAAAHTYQRRIVWLMPMQEISLWCFVLYLQCIYDSKKPIAQQLSQTVQHWHVVRAEYENWVGAWCLKGPHESAWAASQSGLLYLIWWNQFGEKTTWVCAHDGSASAHCPELLQTTLYWFCNSQVAYGSRNDVDVCQRAQSASGRTSYVYTPESRQTWSWATKLDMAGVTAMFANNDWRERYTWHSGINWRVEPSPQMLSAPSDILKSCDCSKQHRSIELTVPAHRIQACDQLPVVIHTFTVSLKLLGSLVA